MTYDFVIVGAGIVGLASAYKLAKKLPEAKILVLEKENSSGIHQTGNNSGVIHSGIYYKPNSYKARNCVEGRRQLIDYCLRHDIQHKICGKVIVATSESEIPRLDKLYERGVENGISEITLLNRQQLAEKEPHVFGLKAIHVPDAGIVNFKEIGNNLEKDLSNSGGEILFQQKVKKISQYPHELIIYTSTDEFKSKYLINCAGLHSDRVARSAGVEPDVKIIPFRGEYYKLKSEAENLIKWLVYPLPNPLFPFLGVHFTRMITGEVECGPNAVLAYKREGYHKFSFNSRDFFEIISYPGFLKVATKHWQMGLGELYRSFSKKAFLKGLRRLLPELKSEQIEAGGAGVRANAVNRNGAVLDDFYIIKRHKQIHVLNAPSPAATASLAIGDAIVNMAIDHFDIKSS